MRMTSAIAIAALTFAATGALAPQSAQAEEYPWCAIYAAGNGSQNCGFVTLEQCRADVSGIGGFCNENPLFQALAQKPPRSRKRN
jgi:hypothetical protein